MNRTDQIVVELYRQAWEANRHPWNLLLSFTSFYVLIGVAVIAYLAQTESGNAIQYLLFILSAFALIGILWTLRASYIAEKWECYQVKIQKLHGITLDYEDPNKISQFKGFGRRAAKISSDLIKTGIGFKQTYLFIYIVSCLATLVAGFLFVFDVLEFSDSASQSATRPVGMTSPANSGGFVVSDAPSLLDLGEFDCSSLLNQAYCAAIRDAAVAQTDEISRNLVAITSDGDSPVLDMRWNGERGKSLLLAATLTRFIHPTGTDVAYDAAKGYKAGEPVLLKRDTWVTIVPELQDFCQSMDASQDNLTLRLQQLLGLPPGGKQPSLVELWVDPADMFRPSIDPAISDREAEILTPQSDRFTTISPTHRDWFNKLISSTYSGEHPFPWTRLGYTYDWGNQDSDIGLSEFVVSKGSSVGVRSISLPVDYCQGNEGQ